jgi:hypothetical protein
VRRTRKKVRHIGDIGLILVAPEDDDRIAVVGRHSSLQRQSEVVDQLQQLTDLIPLGHVSIRLQWQRSLRPRMDKNVMASVDTIEFESECLGQRDELREPQRMRSIQGLEA